MSIKEISNNELIVEYYTETSADYEGWSKGYNMHFGYFTFRNFREFCLRLFNREEQLEQANHAVLSRLNIKPESRYLDMGCGLGATARVFARSYRQSYLDAITITPRQIEQARARLAHAYPHVDNVYFHKMDFQKTIFPSETFEGIYNIESACHAQGHDKKALIEEVYRLLKPGGQWVIHDVFNLSPPRTANGVFRWAYYWLCKGWAVDDYIDKKTFERALHKQGFCNVRFENSFWRVLPSALHIPVVAVRYSLQKMLFCKEFYRNPILRKQRCLHFKASICAPLVALHCWRFGYYVVSAEKPQ